MKIRYDNFGTIYSAYKDPFYDRNSYMSRNHIRNEIYSPIMNQNNIQRNQKIIKICNTNTIIKPKYQYFYKEYNRERCKTDLYRGKQNNGDYKNYIQNKKKKNKENFKQYQQKNLNGEKNRYSFFRGNKQITIENKIQNLKTILQKKNPLIQLFQKTKKIILEYRQKESRWLREKEALEKKLFQLTIK